MSIVNVNTATNVRYGVIDARNVMGLYDDIITQGDSLAYAAWKDSTVAQVAHCLLLPTSAETLKNLLQSLGACRHGIDIICADAIEAMSDAPDEQARLEIAGNVINQCEWDNLNFEEEDFIYTDENGNDFQLGYLGGAPIIWCIKTDKIVYCKSLCSPCIPNGGDLNSGLTTESAGHACYGVPDEYVEDNA